MWRKSNNLGEKTEPIARIYATVKGTNVQGTQPEKEIEHAYTLYRHIMTKLAWQYTSPDVGPLLKLVSMARRKKSTISSSNSTPIIIKFGRNAEQMDYQSLKEKMELCFG